MNEVGVPVIPTKERILDAAEKLLAEKGFEATSLRAITAEAGVNLAAVNYHFQSKDSLIRAVIGRRIEPVNRKRLAMLDAVEAAAGDGPLPIGPVIEAFLRPALELRACNKNVAPIMGRVFGEGGEFFESFFWEHIADVTRRFTAAYERAAPHLTRADVLWRIHFLAGSMAHSMIKGDFMEKISGGLCRPSDIEGLVRRMVAAFTTVFEAPSTEISNHEH